MKKDKIWKTLLVLIAIVLVFAGLSKLFTYNSMSLAEYNSMSLKDYASSKEQESKTSPATEPAIESSAPREAETEPAIAEVIPNSTDANVLYGNFEASPERVTYEDSFYYEPLSDALIATITGVSFPSEGSDSFHTDDLHYLHVLHYDFEGNITEGELICNRAISQDLVEIFYDLYEAQYSIEKIRLIDAYDGDDETSMEDNNTSCFNYRVIDGSTKLSRHAHGLAIDINPLYNPYIRYNKTGSTTVAPAGGEKYTDRTAAFPYKIDSEDLCYRLFKEHGFTWGGDWNSSKDYQHFEFGK